MAFCSQTNTVRDTTPPLITLTPGFQTNFQCFADYQAAPPIVATATDNCDTNPTLTAISGIA